MTDLAVADAAQREPERRAHQPPHGKGHRGRTAEYDPIEHRVITQASDAQVTAQAVFAASDVGPTLADTPDDHAERERQQQEIDAGGAGCDQREHGRGRSRGEHAEHDSKRRRKPERRDRVEHHVGRHAK